jgi:hypothetical protein
MFVEEQITPNTLLYFGAVAKHFPNIYKRIYTKANV